MNDARGANRLAPATWSPVVEADGQTCGAKLFLDHIACIGLPVCVRVNLYDHARLDMISSKSNSSCDLITIFYKIILETKTHYNIGCVE